MSQAMREADMRRYNATPEEIAKAEAIFNAVHPRWHRAPEHPFELWLDPCQLHFLKLARLS